MALAHLSLETGRGQPDVQRRVDLIAICLAICWPAVTPEDLISIAIGVVIVW